MTAAAPSTDLRLAEFIASLSLATDMGMGMPLEDALRVCLLAVGLGEALGLSDEELSDVYYLALLRHIGCTADAHLAAEVLGDEIAMRGHFARVELGRPQQMAPVMIRHIGAGRRPVTRVRMVARAMRAAPTAAPAVLHASCEVAQRLAAELSMGAGVQAALGQVFERWDGKGLPKQLKGEAIARPVRVAQLAQDAEVFARDGGAEAARTMACKRAGGLYDPAIVETFCSQADRLLARLEVDSIWEAVLAAEPGPRPRLGDGGLERAAQAVADLTDLKSPFLSGHSRAVAQLAADAAAGCRLPEADVTAIRRAGLVHDVGRVGVTSAVWNKPGRLTDSEWERVRLHPYFTERILGRPPALAGIVGLAALHHERLDGSGYYRRLPAAMLPAGARVLMAADMYQAMREPRPYREPLSADQAAGELREAVNQGRLDGEMVNAVLTAAGHRVGRARREWPAGLSEREVAVLRLVARGLSNKEMGERLSISPATVHHHVQHIYDKLAVSTRAAATLFAMQHDLVDADAAGVG